MPDPYDYDPWADACPVCGDPAPCRCGGDDEEETDDGPY